MVDFIYEPWKSVVIHEIVQYGFQTLINLQSIGAQAGQLGRSLNWANGIAFRHQPMPATNEVIKEQIQGKVHWIHLAFAFSPEYTPIVTIPDGNVRIPVVNLSDNTLFRDMAEWLKTLYKPM